MSVYIYKEKLRLTIDRVRERKQMHDTRTEREREVEGGVES